MSAPSSITPVAAEPTAAQLEAAITAKRKRLADLEAIKDALQWANAARERETLRGDIVALAEQHARVAASEEEELRVRFNEKRKESEVPDPELDDHCAWFASVVMESTHRHERMRAHASACNAASIEAARIAAKLGIQYVHIPRDTFTAEVAIRRAMGDAIKVQGAAVRKQWFRVEPLFSPDFQLPGPLGSVGAPTPVDPRVRMDGEPLGHRPEAEVVVVARARRGPRMIVEENLDEPGGSAA